IGINRSFGIDIDDGDPSFLRLTNSRGTGLHFTGIEDDGIYALGNKTFNLLYLSNSFPLGIVDNQPDFFLIRRFFHGVFYIDHELGLQAQHGNPYDDSIIRSGWPATKLY